MPYDRLGNRYEKKYSSDQERDEAGRFSQGGSVSNPDAAIDGSAHFSRTATVDGVRVTHRAGMKVLAVHDSSSSARKAGMAMRRSSNPHVFIVTAANQHHLGMQGLSGRQTAIYEILPDTNRPQ